MVAPEKRAAGPREGASTTKRTPPATDATLRLRLTPRASRDEIVGWREPGVLGVRVSAPPIDGRANRAIGGLLGEALGVPRSAVVIVRGERGRDKIVRVVGLGARELESRLARIVAEQARTTEEEANG